MGNTPDSHSPLRDDVTRILQSLERHEIQGTDALLPLVYDELRKLASLKLQQERAGQTLSPTALVHEAYLRLVAPSTPPLWEGRRHFFAAAAEAMRRILIEQARHKSREKHGGGKNRVPLDEQQIAQDENLAQDPFLELDEALSRFANIEPAIAELVKLRFFGGLAIEDAADVLDISRATANRQWAYAKAWLRIELRRDE